VAVCGSSVGSMGIPIIQSVHPTMDKRSRCLIRPEMDIAVKINGHRHATSQDKGQVSPNPGSRSGMMWGNLVWVSHNNSIDRGFKTFDMI
jgi:hypothetical protein